LAKQTPRKQHYDIILLYNVLSRWCLIFKVI